MTDVSLVHGFSVLAGKIDEANDKLPSWKRKALEVKLKEVWEIIEQPDRRSGSRRVYD